MAAPASQLATAAGEYGSDVDMGSLATLSDYGSDTGFEDVDINEDTTLADILDTIRDISPYHKSAILPSIEFEEGELKDEEYHVNGSVQLHKPTQLRLARRTDGLGSIRKQDVQSSPTRVRNALEVEYDEHSRWAWNVPRQDEFSPQNASASGSRGSRLQMDPWSSTEAVLVTEQDTRSPIERFRTKPKKPLSVTDLVSPAWCELQYSYTLSKFGRKPRTQAMRTGSKIHQKLEDEVHTTVPVQVQSKEDRFGLRLWNAISGLRCLRETGLTRELEVWGVVHGQVVNGIIDELSYTCPDSALEERLEQFRAEKCSGTVPLPTGQTSIADAFAQSPLSQIYRYPQLPPRKPNRQIYIADVKTRGINSVPTGASLRPTWMQLMLYRKLLESLSLNTVDAETVLLRYDLAPLDQFTETFMHEIERLNPHGETASYPNLLSLWSLLVAEMQETVPPEALSAILRAEFRYAKTGSVIGSELTVYSGENIDIYLAQQMAWWKGHRDAKGVEVEEAFKCRTCDFAETCSWRKTKVEEATEKSRLRRQAPEKSTV
ncbi:hypothetical protein ACN47E_010320 [Coniothyrium glycines]